MSKICPNCQTINRYQPILHELCHPAGRESTGGTPVSGPTSPDSADRSPTCNGHDAAGAAAVKSLHYRAPPGRGGMGAVYAASDAHHRQAVGGEGDVGCGDHQPAGEAAGDRAFRQEAEMLARLNHPNLPAVTDFFSEGASSIW